jgi:hypothetical protein
MRKRIGLQPNDPSRDADITAALEISLDLAETYLDRKLTKQADEEDFFGGSTAFLLHRWPVDRISGVDITAKFIGSPIIQYTWSTTGSESYFTVDWEKGIVFTPSYARGWPLTITYRGGFDPLPNALLMALLQVFDSVWTSDPMLGGTAGGGIIQGSGAVKKVSLVGIGSVDLDVGATAVGGGGMGGYDEGPWGLIPASAISILSRYRRESVVGIG